MTAKEILLLIRDMYQSLIAWAEFKLQTSFDKKVYLGAEFFFGCSNSEFIETIVLI